MNGARALLHTLVDAGVNVCFANPGTSEMHFVAALDDAPEMRGVLALFEGVATGAADGFARMAGRPAAVLLHLGPGLANGMANLHNARRARSPVVAIVGDHATYHKRFDAPLESDIETAARSVSGWYRASRSSRDLAGDAADAVAAALGPPGRVATLVLPADVSWGDGAAVAAVRPPPAPVAVPDAILAEFAAVLRSGEPVVLFLGGRALREPGLVAAARIAAATGAAMLCETFPARLERGAGLPALDRLPYFAEQATAKLAPYRHVILVDAPAPVSFFAYPGKPSELVPAGAAVHRLASGADDAVGALAALADRLGAPAAPPVVAARRPAPPTGALTIEAASQAIGALLPERAIVVDEAHTSSLYLPSSTAGAPRHDWLTLTGGAIGIGMPLAIGAAIASPGRRVVCLEADGSAMYTPQALWTMARERLDVTTVIYHNAAYAILRLELQRVGAGTGGPKARDMFSLSRPALDFVALARGMGMSAERATTADELVAQLRRALAEPGPHLIEALVPPMV
ncbi:MAG TPA: acetolactate synthase large subunit [Kofleriaceae bacterium]|jgi:acetolactate synthase-1/2/3 large subunit|nr:acetolactate synthase large subunit [Kofleriaceae bacterium]